MSEAGSKEASRYSWKTVVVVTIQVYIDALHCQR